MIYKRKRCDSHIFGWGSHKLEHDGWLLKYSEILDPGGLTVVELGCGFGADTAFLADTGNRIISCDISRLALASVKRSCPEVETLDFDMRDAFPVEDGLADIVTASLCLHFFFDSEMEHILAEIKRIMKPEGLLLCRLNSRRDFIRGREGEIMSESGMLKTREGLKRFFDRNTIEQVFAAWNIISISENKVIKFSKNKVVWEMVLRSGFCPEQAE